MKHLLFVIAVCVMIVLAIGFLVIKTCPGNFSKTEPGVYEAVFSGEADAFQKNFFYSVFDDFKMDDYTVELLNITPEVRIESELEVPSFKHDPYNVRVRYNLTKYFEDKQRIFEFYVRFKKIEDGLLCVDYARASYHYRGAYVFKEYSDEKKGDLGVKEKAGNIKQWAENFCFAYKPSPAGLKKKKSSSL